jgi:Adenosine specific kinase
VALTDEEIRNRLERQVNALEATTAPAGCPSEIVASVIGPTLGDAKCRLSEGDPLKVTVGETESTGDRERLPLGGGQVRHACMPRWSTSTRPFSTRARSCASGWPSVRRRGRASSAFQQRRRPRRLAVRNADAIGVTHSFVVFLRDGFPVNVVNPLKPVPQLCTIFCATANQIEVIIAQTEFGRGVLGVGGRPTTGGCRAPRR